MTISGIFRGIILFHCRMTPVILFFLCVNSSGQNYFFDNYSVNDGLAQTTVFSVIQDQKDNIWLGTKGGVSKFDPV